MQRWQKGRLWWHRKSPSLGQPALDDLAWTGMLDQIICGGPLQPQSSCGSTRCLMCLSVALAEQLNHSLCYLKLQRENCWFKYCYLDTNFTRSLFYACFEDNLNNEDWINLPRVHDFEGGHWSCIRITRSIWPICFFSWDILKSSRSRFSHSLHLYCGSQVFENPHFNF